VLHRLLEEQPRRTVREVLVNFAKKVKKGLQSDFHFLVADSDGGVDQDAQLSLRRLVLGHVRDRPSVFRVFHFFDDQRLQFANVGDELVLHVLTDAVNHHAEVGDPWVASAASEAAWPHGWLLAEASGSRHHSLVLRLAEASLLLPWSKWDWWLVSLIPHFLFFLLFLFWN
jgi:hypothetical protein